jgi:hypothetical protein
MENFMPSFGYEPLVMSLGLGISYEEEDKGDIEGARPLSTRVLEKP